LNTKELILLEALKLFAARGYEGVSVRDISSQLHMTQAALYKHYASKQDIFDKILERMNMDYGERVKKYEIPVDDMDHAAEYYGKIGIEMIEKISEDQFLFWTQDTYGKCFRRMLSIEKYKNAKMAELYQYYFGESVIAYMTELFQKMIDRGMFCDCDGRVLALDFYGPIYLLMSLEDGKTVDESLEEKSKDEKNAQRIGNKAIGNTTEQLRMHVKGFAEKWNMKSNR